MADAAMRWCKHHSILDAAVGDGIIFGASSTSHAQHNIAAYLLQPRPTIYEIRQFAPELWL